MIIKKNPNTNSKISLPIILVFLFITLNFSSEVTKIKNLCVILMIATAIYHLFKDYRTAFRPLKSILFLSVCAFTFAMIYSVIISINPVLSLRDINKPVINSLFLFSFIIPIVLYKETPEKIAKLILFSFSLSLFILFAQDIFLYFENYQKGIIAFSDWSHRAFSDGYVFCFPIILCLWHIYKKNTASRWFVFLAISLFMIVFLLGTLSRGAWLAALVMGVMIIAINKEKTLAILTVVVLALTFFSLSLYNGANQHPLTQKLEQTDSSFRYKNGTQGTAFELIMENPIKGYGFGNDVYHQVYNQQVKNHPQWVFKESIGPHNVFLATWFAAGILGVIAVAFMIFSTTRAAIIIYKQQQNIFVSQSAIVLIMSFIGWFIVRGNVENVYLNVLGIHFGLLIALAFSCKMQNHGQ